MDERIRREPDPVRRAYEALRAGAWWSDVVDRWSVKAADGGDPGDAYWEWRALIVEVHVGGKILHATAPDRLSVQDTLMKALEAFL